MNILLLGAGWKEVMCLFKDRDEDIMKWEERIDRTFVRDFGVDFIISYRYRHIIKPEIIAMLPKKIINLHISYLPWNRGADPNLWSYLDDTPKGVTIHYVDEGIDTGDIIVQEQLEEITDPCETLRTTYKRLNERIVKLLDENLDSILDGTHSSYPQAGEGTYHKAIDASPYLPALTNGWDTRVMDIWHRGWGE